MCCVAVWLSSRPIWLLLPLFLCWVHNVGNLDGPRPPCSPGTRRDVAFLAQSPSNRVRKKSIRCCLALSSGGLKVVEGCASLEPTCPPSRALPAAARVAPCLESDCPGLLLASKASRVGVEALETPVFLTYSLCSLPVGYCAHQQPLHEGRCSPQSSLRFQPQAAAQVWPLYQHFPDPHGPSSYLRTPSSFSCFLSGPQFLANRFPTDLYPTFITAPTRDPLSTGSQVVLSPEQWLKEPGWHDL